MPLCHVGLVGLLLLSAGGAEAHEKVIFQDAFAHRLAPGWTWIREDRAAWRLPKAGGLEIRVQPGNMWGPANDARNVLVHPIAGPDRGTLEISVTVTNHPTYQWEQTDLVWFIDDAHMVKIGQEQVDGVLSLVMGREDNDQARTVAKIPIAAASLDLRLVVSNQMVKGQYRPTGVTAWEEAGVCPSPGTGVPRISLQVYRGPPATDRWARFTGLRVVRRTP